MPHGTLFLSQDKQPFPHHFTLPYLSLIANDNTVTVSLENTLIKREKDVLNNDFGYKDLHYSTDIDDSYQPTKDALSTKITMDSNVDSCVDFTWRPGTRIISSHQRLIRSTTANNTSKR